MRVCVYVTSICLSDLARTCSSGLPKHPTAQKKQSMSTCSTSLSSARASGGGGGNVSRMCVYLSFHIPMKCSLLALKNEVRKLGSSRDVTCFVLSDGSLRRTSLAICHNREGGMSG